MSQSPGNTDVAPTHGLHARFPARWLTDKIDSRKQDGGKSESCRMFNDLFMTFCCISLCKLHPGTAVSEETLTCFPLSPTFICFISVKLDFSKKHRDAKPKNPGCHKKLFSVANLIVALSSCRMMSVGLSQNPKGTEMTHSESTLSIKPCE